MRRLAAILCAFLIALGASADRPKIGLVLSGGGAKGAAHVGVLKVLEENGIPIDCIVGTSMGAIIGGLYSIGYTADELDTLLMSQDWNRVMTDRPDRRNVSFDKKVYADRYVLSVPIGRNAGLLDQRTGDEGLSGGTSLLNRVPLALVSGQNVYNLLAGLSVGYQGEIDFDKMPIPFACVAVDLIGKNEVVFHRGSLVDAIRSSMAIPGYFAPVRLDGKVLIDGGILNNYPVDVAKAMGADIIIGVKLGEMELVEPKVDNIGDMVNEIIGIMMDSKTAEAIANTDIFITPRIENYTALSFDAASLDHLIDNGIEAARSKGDQLAALRDSLDRWERERTMTFVGPEPAPARYHKAVHLDKDTITVGNVIVNGLTVSDAQYLMAQSCFKPGARLTGDMLEDEISRFYNTDSFGSVTYLLKGTEAPYDLELTFTGGGRSTMGVGFSFDTEEIASILLNVGLNNNSLYGSRLSLTTKLSYNLQADLLYSYAFKSVAQFDLGYDARRSNMNVYGNVSDDILNFTTHSFHAGFSSRRYRNYKIDLGVNSDWFNYRTLSYGNEIPEDPEVNDRTFFVSAYGRIRADNRDSKSFPTSGYSMNAGFSYYANSLLRPDESNFSALSMHLSKVWSVRHNLAIIGTFDNRTLFGDDVPAGYVNIAGGVQEGRYMAQQIPFIGFNYAHYFKPVLSVASLDARISPADNHYIFISGAYALDCASLMDFPNGDGMFGARLGYAYNSSIGPLALNLNWSDLTGKVGVFASLGCEF